MTDLLFSIYYNNARYTCIVFVLKQGLKINPAYSDMRKYWAKLLKWGVILLCTKNDM